MSTTPGTSPNASLTRRGLMSTLAQLFRGAKRGEVVALSSAGGSIAVNLDAANNFRHTTTENTTLATPSNMVPGQHGMITFTQGATPRTLAFGSAWKFSGGMKPGLTATGGAVDVLTYAVNADGFISASLMKDVR